MAQITKTLTFLTSDLGRNASLVLTFDTSHYQSAIPLVYKVANFGGIGQHAFTITLQTKYGFICGLPAPVGIVYAFTHINHGEKTILTQGGTPLAHSFSTPTPLQPVSDKIVAQNDAREFVDIGFGPFERLDRPPAQAILFEHVARGSSAQLEALAPTLLGYVSPDYVYKEGEPLRTGIPFPVVFTENLATLESDTYWKLEYNSAISKFVITRSP